MMYFDEHQSLWGGTRGHPSIRGPGHKCWQKESSPSWNGHWTQALCLFHATPCTYSLQPIHFHSLGRAAWDGTAFQRMWGSRAAWRNPLPSAEAQRRMRGTSAQAMLAGGYSPISCRKWCEWHWLEIFHVKQLGWSHFTPSFSPIPFHEHSQTHIGTFIDIHLQILPSPVSSPKFTWCGQLAGSQEGELE